MFLYIDAVIEGAGFQGEDHELLQLWQEKAQAPAGFEFGFKFPVSTLVGKNLSWGIFFESNCSKCCWLIAKILDRNQGRNFQKTAKFATFSAGTILVY